MKKTKNFSEMSVEELQKQEKTLKTVTGVSVGSATALLAILVYIALSGGINGSLVFPLALMPIVLINFVFAAVNWNTIQKIKAELNARTIR